MQPLNCDSRGRKEGPTFYFWHESCFFSLTFALFNFFSLISHSFAGGWGQLMNFFLFYILVLTCMYKRCNDSNYPNWCCTSSIFGFGSAKQEGHRVVWWAKSPNPVLFLFGRFEPKERAGATSLIFLSRNDRIIWSNIQVVEYHLWTLLNNYQL